MTDSDPNPNGEITVLLHRMVEGDTAAADELYLLVYEELHRMARRQMSRQSPNHTLQPTALVHEACLRLSGLREAQFENREHFLGVAARAMRSALVDHARERKAQKRGGDLERMPLDLALDMFEQRATDLLSLDDALARLAEDEPRQARVVELRFFGGLTTAEAASVVGVSVATVERDWKMARMWLRHALGD